jgi:hypothetical protein
MFEWSTEYEVGINITGSLCWLSALAPDADRLWENLMYYWYQEQPSSKHVEQPTILYSNLTYSQARHHVIRQPCGLRCSD